MAAALWRSLILKSENKGSNTTRWLWDRQFSLIQATYLRALCVICAVITNWPFCSAWIINASLLCGDNYYKFPPFTTYQIKQLRQYTNPNNSFYSEKGEIYKRWRFQRSGVVTTTNGVLFNHFYSKTQLGFLHLFFPLIIDADQWKACKKILGPLFNAWFWFGLTWIRFLMAVSKSIHSHWTTIDCLSEYRIQTQRQTLGSKQIAKFDIAIRHYRTHIRLFTLVCLIIDRSQ